MPSKVNKEYIKYFQRCSHEKAGENFKKGIDHIFIGYRSYITIIKELSGNECSQ